MAFTTLACLFTMLFPRVLVQMFGSDPALVDLTASKLPIFVAGVWIFGAQMSCQTFFMALGQAKTSMFIAMLRKIILLIPLALLFPLFWGVDGIYWAEPVADTVAALVTICIWLARHKKLLAEEKSPLPSHT